MASFALKENEGLDLTGKYVAVTGGTQGIGRGIAVRLAAAGASVVVIGRNRTTGDETVALMKEAGRDLTTQSLDFLAADLSIASGIKEAAAAIAARSGDHGIDYLVCAAGGPPTGAHTLNSQGHDKHFAIQVLGRFGLSFLLAKSGTIKNSILYVAAPGGVSGSPPNTDDLELIEAAKQRKGGLLACLKQESGTLDAITFQFATEFPTIRTMHTFPGLVTTNSHRNPEMPRIIVWLATILKSLIGTSAKTYAEIPVYLVTNEKAREANLIFSNERLKDWRPKWVDERPEIAKEVWDKMLAMLNTE